MSVATLGPAEGAAETAVRLVTPERVSFEYALAGPFRRGVAYIVDLLVWLAIVAGTGLVVMLIFQTASGFGVVLVVFFVLQWGYGAFFEVFFNGRTPGKKALGLRVVSENGVPITPGQALTRNLLQSAEGLALWYLPGLISMALSPKFQRLGDMAAGTIVVAEEPAFLGKMARVDEPAVQKLAAELPLRIAAGPELSRALSDYVKRRGRFGEKLREEVAGPLAKALAAKYAIGPKASSDAIVCAVYCRVFLGE